MANTTTDVQRTRVSGPLVWIIGIAVSLIANVWVASKYLADLRNEVRTNTERISELDRRQTSHEADSKQLHNLTAASIASLITDVALLKYQVQEAHPNRNTYAPQR